MKRFTDWFFGALVAGVVLSVLTRKEPATNDAGAAPGAVAAAAPAARLSRRTATGRLMVARLRDHHTVMIAASLAYYAMLSIFPAAIAAVSIYGLVLDPTEVEAQINSLTEALPDDAASVIGDQLRTIVASSSAGLGVAGAIGIVAALWSASAGTKSLITGINIAYGEEETRSFLALRGVALLITFGAIVMAAGTVALVTFLPGLLSDAGLGSAWESALTIARWPAILAIVIVGLGLLYKLAPNRPWRSLPFVSVGAVVAAALWLIATVGLSVYANSFGQFNEVYGTLGGVIVLLLWFFLSGLMILLGAELNDELEERGIRTGARRAVG